jgi:hypothetical protein
LNLAKVTVVKISVKIRRYKLRSGVAAYSFRNNNTSSKFAHQLLEKGTPSGKQMA